MLKKKTNGVTLIELLVAIAIITTLTVGLYVAGSYSRQQARIKHTESTIEILSAALEQYHDFYGKFPFQANANYSDPNLQTSLAGTIGVVGSGVHKGEYSSSEALYYFLNLAPDAKKLIASLNPSSLTNKTDNKSGELRITITASGAVYPLVRVVDAWGKAFRYTYSATPAPGDNFPVITSAGPDKDFGDTVPGKQEDNITSRK